MPFPEGSNDTFKIETKHFKTFLDRLARDIKVDIDEIIDFELDKCYRTEGVPGVNRLLESSETMEHLLSELGAQTAYETTGDITMYNHLVTCKPSGSADVLPDWALAGTRDASKVLAAIAESVRQARQSYI